MDSKKFDLSFLKNYIGETIWSPCYGTVKVTEVGSGKIVVTSGRNNKKHTFNLDGTHLTGQERCMLWGGEEWYDLFEGDPEKSWEMWLVEKKKVRHKVKISVHKEVGGNPDSECGIYSFDFGSSQDAVKFARSVLDYCKSKYQG